MKNFFKGLGSKTKRIFKFKRIERSADLGKGKKIFFNVRKISSKQALKTALIVIILIVFCIELAFAVSIYAFGTQNKASRLVARIIPYPAVFTASGLVTVSEYWKEKDYIEHFYASTQQTGVDSHDLSKQILLQEAENKIIKKEAITFKVNVSKADIEDSMNQIYENNGGQAEVESALQDLYGLSVNEFKELVSVQLLRDKISSDVMKHVTVRHILVRVDEAASDEDVNAAKAKIDGYLNEINNGLSFSDAAQKYSEDTGSNENGGLLEPFAHGDMVKEFEDVAFSSEIGKISEPFRTSFGWHILVVESTSGYIDQSFDSWIEGLIKQNYVLYLLKG